MKNVFDTYGIYARVFPAILCLLPLIINWYYLSQVSEVKAIGEYLLSINFLKEISISIVFLYLFTQIIRITSKIFEELYFTKANGFPTTYLLTFSDKTFSSEFKIKIHNKIKNTFDLELLNEENESIDPEEANRRITEAVNLVRITIGDGVLVLKHNIWYGFFRNLVGGSIYGILFSSIGIIISLTSILNTILFNISIILIGFYIFILFFNKIILIQNAEAYAKQLISEFILSK